jgi:general nucleoside transport system permease protein
MSLFLSGFSEMLLMATPLIFAGIGELLTERAGILNLGLEGIMLVGALAGAVATIETGSPLVGLLAAALAGGTLSAIHAFIVIERAGRYHNWAIILSGLGIFYLGSLTKVLGKSYIQQPVNGFPTFRLGETGLTSHLDTLLRSFAEHNIFVPLAILLAVLLHVFLFKTRWGLRLRLVGENPMAAESVGLNVRGIRWIATVLGGMIVSLGGAALTMGEFAHWQNGITSGKGWIAVGLVVFSGWRPLRLLGGALLFGWVLAFLPRAQLLGWVDSSYLLASLPYLATIIALIVTFKKHAGPSALAQPFQAKERVR